MSISGPSALGTLLVQRLDAVLGTTLSQQTNLASGARPDAVSQPGQPLSPDPVQNETARDPRTAVDKTLEQAGRHLRQTTEKAKLDAQQAILAGRNPAATSSTPSAPTTLGAAARAILTLLMNYPDRAPPLGGKSPLIGTHSTPRAPETSAASQAGGPRAAPGANPAGPAMAQTGSGPVGSQPPTVTNPATGAAGGPGSAASAAPGMPSPTSAASAAQFIQALSQALQNSGLFYESHLGGLAFGKQDLASLRNEPQARLPQSSANAATASGATPTGDTVLRAAGPVSAASEMQNPALPPGQPAQSGALAGLHPETHLLVRQQLEVLANQTIAWRGEAWPNVPMQWEVQREQRSPAGQHDSQADEDHWATRLTLNLPRLGEVQARINLSGQQLAMQLVAPASAGILDKNQGALRAQLMAQGLPVNTLSIHDSAPAGETANEPPATETPFESP